MKGKFEILMVIAVLCLPGVMSGKTDPFYGNIEYSVTLPMAEDDIVYKLKLASVENPGDSLLGQNYLIQWTLPSDAETHQGFAAYFDGNLYNFRDLRLREYHYLWDSIPFQTRNGGVHRNVQFLNLFPFSIESELSQMKMDSTYTISESYLNRAGARINKFNISREINGLEALQMELEFDAESGLPLRIHQLFNPGMLGEQEISARYSYPNDSAFFAVPASEEDLIDLYPDTFERFRTSNYSVENLKGKPLPTFALLTSTRERYTYNKEDGFPTPMILALLDPEVCSSASAIAQVRKASSMLPRQTDILFVFISNNIDEIEQLTGEPRIGENILFSARALARDLGANAYPTFILINSDGTIADTILGNSSELYDNLLQKSSLLK